MHVCIILVCFLCDFAPDSLQTHCLARPTQYGRLPWLTSVKWWKVVGMRLLWLLLGVF